MPQSHTLKTMYEDYRETHDNPLSYEEYRTACEEFNKRSMDKIIEGKRLNMGSYLSELYIVRVKRDFSSLRVNWGATNKYKQALLSGEAEDAPDEGYKEEDLYSKENPDGIEYFIYYTDPWYCKFHWRKVKCKVRNKTAYQFTATRGAKGNKTKLKERLKEDDLHYKNYRLIEG